MTLLIGLLVVVAAPGGALSATASEGRGAFFGSVATGPPSAEALELSLADAVDRGLQHNLAALLAEQRQRFVEGSRLEALSDLLPHVSGELSASRQVVSLDAFGFTGFPGLETLVGPFNVFDARLRASLSVFNLEHSRNLRAENERRTAAAYTYQDTRDLVTLVCGNLYLATVTEQSRIEASRAQVQTARALHQLAVDRKEAGLVPALDVIRAEVELRSREQGLIVADNRLARARLALARAIGLSPGQEFRLTDPMPRSLPAALDLEEGLRRAYENRSDWKSALAQVRAAEAERQSARGEGLPSLEVGGDYGAIGQTVGGSRATYRIAAAVKVPLFEGHKVEGKTLQKDAALEASRARLEDLRGEIDFEVRTAFLDLGAAAARVGVADLALSLARQELGQARDRFEAGVASNLEVVQAQETVADATESDIAAVYDLNAAKAAAARALGAAEKTYLELVRGN